MIQINQVFIKKYISKRSVLQKSTYQRLDVSFFRKRTLAQIFLCKFCEIFRMGFLQKNSQQPLLIRCFSFIFADQRGLQPKINIFGGAIVKLEKEFTSPFSSWQLWKSSGNFIVKLRAHIYQFRHWKWKKMKN